MSDEKRTDAESAQDLAGTTVASPTEPVIEEPQGAAPAPPIEDAEFVDLGRPDDAAAMAPDVTPETMTAEPWRENGWSSAQVDAPDSIPGSDRPETAADGTGPDDRPAGMAETAAAAGIAAAAAMAPSPEPARAPPRAPEREIVRETVVRRGGVVPGLIGGAIGGAVIAFGAPALLPPGVLPVPGLSAVETRLTAAETEMRAAMGEAAKAADVAPLAAGLAETRDALGQTSAAMTAGQQDLVARIEGLQSALAAVSAEVEAIGPRLTLIEPAVEGLVGQVDALERRPIAESPDPMAVAAVQSYARELEALRAEVQAEIAKTEEALAFVRSEASAAREAAEAVTVAAREEVAAAGAAAREEAATLAAAAAERARVAALQQAVVDVQAALETGAPFAEALARLGETPIPAALAAVAETGVKPLAALRESFPLLAREALAVARRQLSGEDPVARGVAFLQRQLGVRSLAPREGNDPDAVLSRAESALIEGRLTDAVAELDALPEDAKAVVADWAADAMTRAAAVAAADELATGLTPN